jgi:hypothetical protein
MGFRHQRGVVDWAFEVENVVSGRWLHEEEALSWVRRIRIQRNDQFEKLSNQLEEWTFIIWVSLLYCRQIRTVCYRFTPS